MHIARPATRNAFFAILPLLAVLAGCATGVGKLRAGQVLSDRVGFAGEVFPLPPGRWRVFYAHTKRNTVAGGFNKQTPTVVLVQERAGVATGVGLFAVDRLEGRAYFGTNPACVRHNLLWRRLAHANHLNFGVSATFDCAIIVPSALPAAGSAPASPPLVALAAAGAGRPGWIPPLWLDVSYFKSVGSQEVLLASYRFDPRALGDPADALGGFWARGRMSATQTAILDRLSRWALASWPAVHRGMAGAGGVGPLAAP